MQLYQDVSETDPYGRLLKYVVVDGVFVNYALAKEGFARAATFPPDTACADTFVRAARSAEKENLGLWAE